MRSLHKEVLLSLKSPLVWFQQKTTGEEYHNILCFEFSLNNMIFVSCNNCDSTCHKSGTDNDQHGEEEPSKDEPTSRAKFLDEVMEDLRLATFSILTIPTKQINKNETSFVQIFHLSISV